MREAARNEGGGAGLGMGAGIGLGQSMAQSLNEQATGKPVNNEDPMAKLTQLKKMFDAELITEAEYQAKKLDILERF